MDIDRYTVLGFFAVVVLPVTVLASAASALSSDEPKAKPVVTHKTESIKSLTAQPVVESKIEIPVVKEKIRIKDIYIGMPYQDFHDIALKGCAKDYGSDDGYSTKCAGGRRGPYVYKGKVSSFDTTLAGYPATITTDWENNVLKAVQILLPKDSGGYVFQEVKQALASKYELKCSNSEVRNRMNASFDHQKCSYDDGTTYMRFVLRDGSIDHTTLAFWDKTWNNEQAEKRTKATIKDI